MPGNFKGEDARIQRTYGALMDAMTKLLGLRNFNQITVNDLCEEAQIVRATFYSHFQDKYDLLERWLIKTKSENMHKNSKDDIEKRINVFVHNNRIIIRHLIESANSEAMGLLSEFILSLLDIDKMANEEINSKHTVLVKFCCGGIMSYLEWQASNKTVSDSREMDAYFCDILNTLKKWYIE